MSEKEWSEDPEDDPVELQKQQIALGKEFMARLKAEDADRKRREEEYAANPPQLGAVREYKPPTFEEVSSTLKKAWDEVERIMPNATDTAKSYAFQTLVHASAGPPGFLTA